MNTNNDWAGPWVAARLREEKTVAKVDVLSPSLVAISRTNNPPVVVAAIAAPHIDEDALLRLYGQEPAPGFVVNVSRESALASSAFHLSMARGIPVGGMGDLKRALSLTDISKYVNPELEFVERGMRQHTRVDTFERLDERRYRVFRKGLPPFVVILINEYDLTADHVRNARDRYGDFDRILVTNPNGRITASAQDVVESLGVIAGHWRDFMRDLHK